LCRIEAALEVLVTLIHADRWKGVVIFPANRFLPKSILHQVKKTQFDDTAKRAAFFEEAS